MESSFLTWTLSFLFLLTVSSFTYILSKKINFPYTVLLVIIWLILVPLSETSFCSFVNDFELSPDILFFVFLPVLLFESAYNINYRQLLKNWKSIFSLSVVWLNISALIVSFALFLLFPLVWFEIPFLVCLLFWIIISATDPVAVLSIFKSVWAPRRLALIFEWESLFNDWTALALFLVILWIILEWTWTIWSSTYLSGFSSFLSMAIWWIIFWIITWVLFSKIIWWIKNNESVEITLTMVLAHLTFILAEVITHHLSIFWFDLQISGVISTTIAWIIIWNYWRYKISPKVEEYMEKFWWFFAFISNSIVFILLWLIISTIDIDFSKFYTPIALTIWVVVIARAISVYLPIWFINFFSLEEKIPLKWQHLLAWWSLRWALALMMVLMIPGPAHDWYAQMLAFEQAVWWNYDFSIKDFITVITISSIMFTLFIKATSISSLLKFLWLDKLNKLEEFEYEEWKILANLKILDKLNKSYRKAYLTEDEYLSLKQKYELKLKEAVFNLRDLLKKQWKNSEELIKRAISLHALGIEKQYLKNLYFYNEINERNFKFILNKITRQTERLEKGSPQLKKFEEKTQYDFLQKFLMLFRSYNKTDYIDRYTRNRARVIITRKVVKELKELRWIEFWFAKSAFDEIIDLYEWFNKTANEKKEIIFAKYKTKIEHLESKLVDKSLLKLEEKVIKDLYDRDIITPKLYIKFIDEIEKELYMDFRKA